MPPDPPQPPERPERLTGPVIELRPIADWDIPDVLIAFQDDRSLASALGLDRVPTGAQLGAEVEQAARAWAAGDLKLTLVRPGSNDCCGRLVIDLAAATPDAATCVVWVVPDLRGRGLARAAVALARDWLALSCGIEQLQCGEDRPRGG